jgi:PAS domain S-box-containing protein
MNYHDKTKETTGFRQTEKILHLSKNQLQLLFVEMMQGVAINEMIYNENGKAVDFRILNVNKAFETIMNVRKEQVINQLASSIFPERELKKWIAIFASVARGEGSKNYKQYSQLKDKYFEGVVFSVRRGQFWVTYEDFTKRRFAERALQKSEEKWRKLVTTIPSYIALFDLNGRVVFLNHYTDGFSEKDIIGRSLFDFIFEDSKDEYRRNYEACILTKQNQHFVFSGLRNKKYIRIYENYLVPIIDKDLIVNVMAIVTDITEQKLAEEKLQESEERYRRLVEGSPDSIVVHNKGRVIFVNPAGAKLIGAKGPQELIGNPIINFVHPESRREVIDRLRRVVNGKEASPFVGKLVKYDGSVIDVEVVGIPYPYKGHIARQDIIRDITLRKQTEEALLLEKENFRHSLEDSPLGVRIATLEGKTIYANKTLLNFYGYNSLEELQETALKDRYTPESYVQAQKRKHRREHGDFSDTDYEISIIRKNGEIRHLRIFRKDVLWDGARQFLVVCYDITEHRKAENEIRKSKRLLERLNQHLNEVREEERTAISREIHDELGQSMTALKLDLNLMHQYVSTNSEAVKKLQRMIELISGTIKNVQRISSDLRPGILDDLGLVSAIEWYSEEFENRTGIKCNLKLDSSDFKDPQINLTLFRVLQEILTNVIRHAKASTVNITLYKSHKGTTLTIQDNGIGIPEKKIESTKSLGLIGMQERVKYFGGRFYISTKQGQGTKLTIFIPEKKETIL